MRGIVKDWLIPPGSARQRQAPNATRGRGNPWTREVDASHGLWAYACITRQTVSLRGGRVTLFLFLLLLMLLLLCLLSSTRREG
jgi:hypothetical protein